LVVIIAHLREENDYWRNPDFLKFTSKPEYRILKFLMAHIVRESKGYSAPTGAIKIYRKYFKKGMLAASYSMKDIARIFGWFWDGHPNKGYVSRLIKNLKEMNLLYIHKEPTPVGEKFVYQLGIYEGTYGEDDYRETLFFDVYFSGLVKIQKAQKIENQRKEIRKNISPELEKQIEEHLISLDEERKRRAL
jgi:hypothetical protein